MKFITIKSAEKTATHKNSSEQFVKIIEITDKVISTETPIEAASLEDFIASNGLIPVTPVPPKVPQSISAWKAKAILSDTPHGSAGTLFSAVEDAIAAMPESLEKTTLRSAWQFNADLDRNSNAVTQLSTLLGLSKEQVDNLFIEASKLAF